LPASGYDCLGELESDRVQQFSHLGQVGRIGVSRVRTDHDMLSLHVDDPDVEDVARETSAGVIRERTGSVVALVRRMSRGFLNGYEWLPAAGPPSR
jgi:hypothetical protein